VTSPHDAIAADRSPDLSPGQWPPDDLQPTDCDDVEPMVDVPAGLIGTAIELLELCDELFNRPGSKTLDTTVAAVLGRYQRADVATLRWFHDGLGMTAGRLHELLEHEGIVVEPELHGRHGQLYHP